MLLGASEPLLGQDQWCETVQLEQCNIMSWNSTSFPNVLGHQDQTAAMQHWNQEMQPLLATSCSPVLLFLLCSLHVPLCHHHNHHPNGGATASATSGDESTDLTARHFTIPPHHRTIPPCFGVCQQARTDCHQQLVAMNMSWPDSLACEDLPLRSHRRHNGLCISLQSHSLIIPDTDSGTKIKFKVRNKGCKCRKTKLSRKVFLQKNYDFALRASYSTTQGIRGGPLVIHIRPMHILTQSTLPIEQGSTITLWSQKGCMCTRMKEGREYLILGYEDVEHNRLLFDSRTMVVPWKDSWEAKITRWERISERQSMQSIFGRNIGRDVDVRSARPHYSRKRKRRPRPRRSIATDTSMTLRTYMESGNTVPKKIDTISKSVLFNGMLSH